MAQKGIHRDAIIAKAMDLISRSGNPEISMRELAEALGIRTPSLYNHIKSLEELRACVSSRAAEVFRDALTAAMAGKTGDAAVYALADAYRRFAKENKGLYLSIMTAAPLCAEIGQPPAGAMLVPIIAAVSAYGLTGEQVIHWQRVLRSILHGFVSQEEAGFFSGPGADMEQSFARAIFTFLYGIKAEGEAHCHV